MRKSPAIDSPPNSLFHISRHLSLQFLKSILFLLLAATVIVSCDQPKVINDLSNQSFQVVDQDSNRVTFPDDFKNQVTVIGFIYTNCPNICPLITANMSNVDRQLENKQGVHFVGVTFDPKRDTPSVLKKYMQQFKLNENRFTFLTGDTTTVNSLLDAFNIKKEITSRKVTDSGDSLYFFTHTNRISVLDPQGRLRLEFSGSYTRPDEIIEGINKLR